MASYPPQVVKKNIALWDSCCKIAISLIDWGFECNRLITTVGGKNVLVFFTPTSRQEKFQAVIDQRGQRLRRSGSKN
jgi:hypothetical protein